MIWIVTHNNSLYKDLTHLSKKFYEKTGKKIAGKKPIYMPEKKDVIANVLNDVVFIAPYYPEKIGFDNYGFFSVVDFDDFITDENIEYLGEEQVLKERLGLRIYKPKVAFKNMAGAKKLINDAQMFRKMEQMGQTIGGIFLFGVPGTGKSFFAECFAGETGRKVVDLDLSYISYTDNPSKTLLKVFEILLESGDKFVLLLDEIEKVFDTNNYRSMQVLGRLLTLLNDIVKENIQELVFIATANNITKIRDNNPEFLRKGRFRKLYFLNFPSMQSAKEMFSLYFSMNIRKFEKYMSILQVSFIKNIKIENLIRKIDVLLQEYKVINDNDKFIYTPAEINVFTEELFINYLINKITDLDDLISISAKEITPIQFSARDSIQKMLSQNNIYSDSAFDIKAFTEIS
ncbi:AAA family ATPase [Caminibacter pacificus]|uniref:Uncharacterized AAA domain-containing protein ycf46 n=1 Tax=Caminibacter pacificus TaxID=1424653 RepID=A0AAJ4RB72_9BACT|nr:AAA family ATPase [Caminibacter pacificus]QDD68160.1 ATP-binding protein [Caminibacter pacificus]ROR38778.1 ATPase family protein associated with various cellular activities (AAA) [Caminibacter pacificus]